MFKILIIIIFSFLVLSLSACSTSTIVPTGNGYYTVSSAQDTFFTYSDRTQREVMSEASEFCSAKNKKMKIKNFSQTPTTFGKYATATLIFSCE